MALRQHPVRPNGWILHVFSLFLLTAPKAYILLGFPYRAVVLRNSSYVVKCPFSSCTKLLLEYMSSSRYGYLRLTAFKYYYSIINSVNKRQLNLWLVNYLTKFLLLFKVFSTWVLFRAKKALPAAWNFAIAFTTFKTCDKDIPLGSEQSWKEESEQEFLKTITPAPSVLWELYTHCGVKESMKVCLEWILAH